MGGRMRQQKGIGGIGNRKKRDNIGGFKGVLSHPYKPFTPEINMTNRI